MLSSHLTPKQVANGITAGLLVTVHNAEGQLIKNDTRYLPHDLILDAFNNYIASLLDYGTLNTNTGAPGNYFFDSYSSDCPSAGPSTTCGIALEIGTGTGTVARTDTALFTVYSGLFADTSTNPTFKTSSSINGATCNAASETITGIGGTQSITSSVTITEAGMYATALGATILWTHDTFTGIPVVSGDTVSLSYTINLPTGFSANMCNVLAGVLAGNIGSGDYVPITLTPVSGSAVTFYTWTASGCNSNCGYILSAQDNAAGASQSDAIAIGTGATAFSYSSVSLTSKVSPYQAPTIRTYTSTTALATNYFTTSFTLSTSNSITEAGYFLSLTSSGTQNWYLMFGTTFTGQSETANVLYGLSIAVGD